MDKGTEQLMKKQAEMSDELLIETIEKQITELARTGGRSHKMCVPPEITDTDMMLSELVRRFKKAKLPCEIEIKAEIVDRMGRKNLDNEAGILRTVWYERGFLDCIKWLKDK